MLSMMAAWTNSAWYLCFVLQAALIWRLYSKRLIRTYPCLTALLVASFLQFLILSPLDQSGLAYGHLWAVTEIVLMLIQIWMVLKIFHATANYYPSMGIFRYQALLSIIVLSIVASLTIMHFGGSLEIAALPVRASMALKSYVSWALLVILLLSTALFAFVRVPIKANLLAHRWICTAYLGFSATAYLLFMGVGKQAIPYAGVLDMTAEAACLVLWLVKLCPAGEYTEPVISTPESRAEIERRYIASCNELDALLLAVRRGDRDDRTTEFEF